MVGLGMRFHRLARSTKTGRTVVGSKGPLEIREAIMLPTRSQLARRSLGVLRQQLEHHVQLIEHVPIRPPGT